MQARNADQSPAPGMRQQPSPQAGPMSPGGMAPSYEPMLMSNPMYSSGGVAPRVGSAGPQMPNMMTSGPRRSPGMGPMSNTMLLPRTGPQMPNMGPNMGPMSNPSLLPPRPGSSGAQMPNMMLYQSAGGDSGPPSNDLYRSYEQFAGGVDPRMYESPMQHANVADQFVHSFGGFGPHGQAKGVGVGIRVEFNQARDLVVARVNEGGSAQRDGTVRVGDILLAIGQTLVEGKTLVQLRPFMIGPRGSLVTLTFKRQVHGSGEFSEYTIELMRGDSLYFLQVENQVAESKLEIFRSNINEVKVEMDNMRTVLAQAQGRVKMTESEMQTMQTRYRQMQNAIEKCIGDIADERQMQANLRDNLQRIESENPYKEQLGAYHEKLTRVEATLGEVMSELGGEHGASCKLLTELDQEHSIAKLIAEKIRNHEGLVARSSEQTTSIEDVLAQRHEEMEHLKNQIAETQAEARRIEQEFETELADSNASQKERADLEVQLDCVRAAVMEAESEMEREVQKGKRLVEKQELVRIVADKRQQASGGLHTVMEREDERKEDMLRETRAERRRLRDGASHRQQDLRMQIDTIKDINVQLQNKILVTITEHESAKHNLKFETKISEDKLEAERTRTDATKDDFEKLAQQIREAQQHMLEANDATAECARDEEKHVADISRVHRSVAEMDRLFHHLFQVSKTREDYLRGLRHEHDNYLHSVQMTVDESKNNMEEIRGAEARTQQEMQRCRKAMQKIAELHSEFSNRKSFFQGKSLEHLRDTEHVFQHHHNGLREQLAALSALNPDNFFKFSQVTNNTISDALLNVQKIMQDYATARARFDDGRTTLSDELQTGHQQHLLPRRQYARDMQEVDWGHGMQQAASAAICVYGTSSSYTDQLVARSPAILPSQRQRHSSKEMVDGPITTFQLFSPPSRDGIAAADRIRSSGAEGMTVRQVPLGPQLTMAPKPAVGKSQAMLMDSMMAAFASGNTSSAESTPSLAIAPSPSPMQRSAPPPQPTGLQSSFDFPRVLHVEGVPNGLLRASFSNSTTTPRHEAFQAVSGGSKELSSASLRDELHKESRPPSPPPVGLGNDYTNVTAYTNVTGLN